MIPRLIDARYLDGCKIQLFFSDGTFGDVDFGNELSGEIFEPLKNIEFFREFRVDSELHTITWPNGADFAPEFLFDKVMLEV